MKKTEIIFQQGAHQWIIIARDTSKPGYIIDTNEFLVINKQEAILTDPGGMEIFPAVFSAIASVIDPLQISRIFSSHQDPDIISSLSLWLDFNPQVKCYLSWLWSEFIPHFGGNDETFINMPDEGMVINLGDVTLDAVPAHYLHSSGNFHLYDRAAKILFSGDVGAALLPPEEQTMFVKDFDQNIKRGAGFHRRWMASNASKRDWCERVSKMQIDMLCPQHGAIYQGADVERFINWFDELEVGVGWKARRKEPAA